MDSVPRERYEIRPAAWKMALLVVGLLAFVALGAALIALGGLLEGAVGLLSIVFFGGFGGYAMYRFSRGMGRLAIVPGGLEITMFGPAPRLIPWSDVETIGVATFARQQFTTVRLRRYGSLIDGLTEKEARSALRQYKSLVAMARATAVVGAINLSDVSDLSHFLSGTQHVTSVVDVLRHTRATYGAEILLPWNMRDRGAREFADFLEECRRQMDV